MRRVAYSALVAAFWGGFAYLLYLTLDGLPSLDRFSETVDSPAALAGVLAFAALFLVAMALRTARFTLFMRCLADVPRGETTAAFLWAFMLGAVSPLRAGEGMRLVWARRVGIDLPGATLSLFLERGADLGFLLVFLAAGLAALLDWVSPGLALAGAALLPPVGLVAGGVLLRRLALPRRFTRLTHRALGERGTERLRELVEPALFLRFALLTSGIWLAMAGAFWAGYGGMVGTLSPVAVLTLLSAVNLSFLAPLLPANLGGYQIVAVAALDAFGVAADVSLAASIVVHALSVVLILLAGGGARMLMQVRRYRAAR